MEYKGCQINLVSVSRSATRYQIVNGKGQGIAYALTESAAKAIVTKYLKHVYPTPVEVGMERAKAYRQMQADERRGWEED